MALNASPTVFKREPLHLIAVNVKKRNYRKNSEKLINGYVNHLLPNRYKGSEPKYKMGHGRSSKAYCPKLHESLPLPGLTPVRTL